MSEEKDVVNEVETNELKTNELHELTRADVQILTVLSMAEATSIARSLTANEIFDDMKKYDYRTSTSKMTIHRRLQYMLKLGYVQRGLLAERAHTYLITDKGFEFVTE